MSDLYLSLLISALNFGAVAVPFIDSQLKARRSRQRLARRHRQ